MMSHMYVVGFGQHHVHYHLMETCFFSSSSVEDEESLNRLSIDDLLLLDENT